MGEMNDRARSHALSAQAGQHAAAERLWREQLAGRAIRRDPGHYVVRDEVRHWPGTGQGRAWDKARELFEDVHGRFGSEPPRGTVLRWRSDDGEWFVAIRDSDGQWSAENGVTIADWTHLVGEIGNAECQVAVQWRDIPRAPAEPEGDDAVSAWAAQFLPASDSAPVVDVDPDGVQ